MLAGFRSDRSNRRGRYPQPVMKLRSLCGLAARLAAGLATRLATRLAAGLTAGLATRWAARLALRCATRRRGCGLRRTCSRAVRSIVRRRRCLLRGRRCCRRLRIGFAGVIAVKTRTLEYHADGIEDFAQSALAFRANGQRVVGECLVHFHGMTAFGTAVLIGGHDLLLLVMVRYAQRSMRRRCASWTTPRG